MKETTVLSERTEQYQLTWDAYTGGGGFADGCYVNKFRREADANYAVRQQNASYTNRLYPILQAQVSPVYSQPAKRSASNMDEILMAFLKDTDNNGKGIQSLVREAVENTKVLGNFYIVMDNFKASELPDTKAEVVSDRKLPYVYTKSVMDVESYVQDKFGALEEITFCYGAGAPSEEHEQVYLYKRFTCFGSEKYEQSASKEYKRTIYKNTHNLGRVPVIFYDKNNLTPQPPYYQLAKQSKKLYNIESEINDLQKAQSFSILLIPSTNPNGEKDGSRVIGKYNSLDYDSNNGQAPSFISPDSSLMKSSLDYYESVKADMTAAADILGSTASQRGSQSESGNALAFKWFGKMQSVRDVARMSESIEREVVEVFGLFVGTVYNYRVVYDDKFTPTYDEQALRLASSGAALKMNLSGAINKKLKVDIANILSVGGNWSQEELDDIIESFDDTPIIENEFETKNQAV